MSDHDHVEKIERLAAFWYEVTMTIYRESWTEAQQLKSLCHYINISYLAENKRFAAKAGEVLAIPGYILFVDGTKHVALIKYLINMDYEAKFFGAIFLTKDGWVKDITKLGKKSEEMFPLVTFPSYPAYVIEDRREQINLFDLIQTGREEEIDESIS